MPCLNSSGNVASDASCTPRARKPFHVNATVTQRCSCWTDSLACAADCAFSRMAASQALPPAAFPNDRNSYRPVRAGVRVRRMCWMSSSSSMTLLSESLHLVEHLPKSRFQPECLLDFVGADVRILAIFEKARALVLAYEFNEGGSIRLPVFREAFEILEDGVHTRRGKNC